MRQCHCHQNQMTNLICLSSVITLTVWSCIVYYSFHRFFFFCRSFMTNVDTYITLSKINPPAVENRVGLLAQGIDGLFQSLSIALIVYYLFVAFDWQVICVYYVISSLACASHYHSWLCYLCTSTSYSILLFSQPSVAVSLCFAHLSSIKFFPPTLLHAFASLFLFSFTTALPNTFSTAFGCQIHPVVLMPPFPSAQCIGCWRWGFFSFVVWLATMLSLTCRVCVFNDHQFYSFKYVFTSICAKKKETPISFLC